jgi:FAD synthetase
MKTVLCFGTFDILHPGHLFFLREAKKLGRNLTVVVARDSTVKEVKGEFPANSEAYRLDRVAELEFVDKALLGSTGNKLEVVWKIKPDVVCLGYDQQSFTEHLKEELGKRDLKVLVVRLPAYKEDRYKSSKLKLPKSE